MILLHLYLKGGTILHKMLGAVFDRVDHLFFQLAVCHILILSLKSVAQNQFFLSHHFFGDKVDVFSPYLSGTLSPSRDCIYQQALNFTLRIKAFLSIWKIRKKGMAELSRVNILWRRTSNGFGRKASKTA